MEQPRLFGQKKRMPRVQVLCLPALAAALLYLLAGIPVFAEHLFARGVTRVLSAALTVLSNAVPFSLYECGAVALTVVLCVSAVRLVLALCRRRFARAGSLVYRLCLFALALLIAFGALYAPLYERAPAAEALGIPAADVTQQTVYAAAEYFAEELSAVSEQLPRGEDGRILPPLSFDEVADALNAAYASLGNYFSGQAVRPKAVALSVPMSYLGITGIYIPFFGEASVNVNIPVYQLPQTMAHEMAHAKGVSRENEANVVSYFVCIASEEAYLRYSALMPVTATLLNALPRAERERLRDRLPAAVLADYAAASEHYARYEGAIDRISSFFNDLFLKANGVSSGTASYGETVAALVGMYALFSA